MEKNFEPIIKTIISEKRFLVYNLYSNLLARDNHLLSIPIFNGQRYIFKLGRGRFY